LSTRHCILQPFDVKEWNRVNCWQLANVYAGNPSQITWAAERSWELIREKFWGCQDRLGEILTS
jgi:hypothetical protein